MVKINVLVAVGERQGNSERVMRKILKVKAEENVRKKRMVNSDQCCRETE